MTDNTWVVDPLEYWKVANREWFLEANLPDTPRCELSLTGHRCELKAGHTCSHAITLSVFAGLPEVAPDT